MPDSTSAITPIADSTEISPRFLQGVGWNKNEISSLSTNDDLGVLTLWIKERASESANTKANYIREVNRFILWLDKYARKQLTTLSREDFFRYRDFLTSPPKDLCGPKVASDSADWKPFFTATPKPTSVKLSFGIVCAMFAWLKAMGHIKLNPIEKAPRSKSTPQWRRRTISESAILGVQDCLFEMPGETPLQTRRKARLRWMFNLFLFTGMRISEAQSTKMGAFFTETRNGKSRTFIGVHGKGNKERFIPVLPEFTAELRIYRESIGLPPYPTPSETTPLICSIENDRPYEEISRQALHNAVKFLIEKARERLINKGQHDDAEMLTKISAHWFRHTYATTLLDRGADMRTARDNLGHSNISITNVYSHSDLDKRFDDTEKHSKA